MKKPEEIEQLAEKYYPSYPDGIITDEIKTLREGFIKGYRCQEDMADEKYTEEDLIDAVIFGMRKGLNVGLEAETDCDWVNSYIKLLNKKD